MRARPYPVLVAFGAFLAGVQAAGMAGCPHALLLAAGGAVLAFVATRVRGLGPPRGALAAHVLVGLGVLRTGIGPGPPPRPPLPWVEAERAATPDGRVEVLVEVDRVLRRDRVETSADGRAIAIRRQSGWLTLEPPPPVRLKHPAFLGMRSGETSVVRGRLLRWRARSDAISPAWPRPPPPPVVFVSREADRVEIRGGSGGGPGHGIAAAVDRVRLLASERIRLAVPGEAADFAMAILLGEDGAIDPGLRSDLSALGTSHVLSVSGLHVAAAAAFIGVVVARCLGPLLAPLSQSVNLVLLHLCASFAGAFLVAALAGAVPPACRAAGMFAAAVAARLCCRPQRLESTASAVGLASLLAYPSDAFDLSFLLSYSAVIGMATAASPLSIAMQPRRFRAPADGWRARAWRTAAGAVAVTVSASLPLTPITVLAFGTAGVWAPVANLVVVPATTLVVMPVALMLLALALAAPSLLAVAGPPAGLLFDAFNGAQHAAAGMIGPAPAATGWAGVAVVAATFAAWVAVATGSARAALTASLAATAVVATLAPPGAGARATAPPPGALSITFLDVGKGDAALVRCPDGPTWLLDTGEGKTFDRHRGLRAKLLAARVRRLDGVVLTHADADHVGGMARLAEVLPVGRVSWPCAASGEAPVPALAASLARKGVETGCLRAGMEAFPGCGAGADVLWPPDDTPRDGNAASLAIRVEWAGATALLTGDLDQAAEEALVEAVAAGRTEIAADVLQLAHHGSSSSSGAGFLAAVGASHAVASGAGGGSRREPGPDVVGRVAAAGARLWATSMCGDVTVTLGPARTDGAPGGLDAAAAVPGPDAPGADPARVDPGGGRVTVFAARPCEARSKSR
ncbi:MAG: ComEC/Rec2 family competence protein [Deltaproteobacteria bacterium]|nr:ComEC/Rec2 family competence protein [Deltaproteobacteria bacterium]